MGCPEMVKKEGNMRCPTMVKEAAMAFSEDPKSVYLMNKSARTIKQAMKVLHSRTTASTPELSKAYGIGKGGISDAVIYKPFLRGAGEKSSKKYKNIIKENFFGMSGDEVKQYKNLKLPNEKKEWLKARTKERGWSGRTTLRARKPLIFGRKKYDKAVANPHQKITLFNKDKYNLKNFMHTSRSSFGRFKNPMKAYKSYNRKGWQTGKNVKQAAFPSLALKGAKILSKSLWKVRPKTVGQAIGKGLTLTYAGSTAKGLAKSPKILKAPGIMKI